jgi:hypothetical protein
VAPNPSVEVGPFINGTAQDSLASNWTAIVNYVRVIGPTMVNEVSAGALRTHLDFSCRTVSYPSRNSSVSRTST